MTEKFAYAKYTLYLAVLPKYRTECIRILSTELGESLKIFVSPAHLDKSVRTGIPSDMYQAVSMVRILGKRAFVQVGSWRTSLGADTAVLDLNPRSITAWCLLVARRALRRRTLLWGHIHPQAGPGSRTAVLRRSMRRLASGTISYTYRDAAKAVRDIPGSRVWVAPNSLYKENAIAPAVSVNERPRNAVLYVGRFVPAKRVSLLIEGFATAVRTQPTMRLILVGGGEDEARLRELADTLGVGGSVEFAGWIDDLQDLLPLYSQSFCSASPGFAGLGLTQSLGFGIPMVVADQEPHSPEIELEDSGGVHYFQAGSSADLSKALLRMWATRGALPDRALSEYTRVRYSAEAMALGLKDAIEAKKMKMDKGEVLDGPSQ